MSFIIVQDVSTTSDTQNKNYETLLVERNGGVVTITFNRPKRKNAVNGVMWIELLELLTEIQHTSSDRVVVLTGANDEFCSGADLVAMGDGSGRAHSHCQRAPDHGQQRLLRVGQRHADQRRHDDAL